MTSTTAARTGTAPAGTTGDVVRQVSVAAGSVLATAAAAVGAGAFGGTSVEDAAGGALSAEATPLAPGEPAFTIWSVIYAGHLAYAVWQALPAHRADPRQRDVGWLVVASLVLNAAWLGVVQLGSVGLSVVVIAVLLGVLVVEVLRLGRHRPRSWVEAAVVDVPVGLYLGWVCVATVANVAAFLATVVDEVPGGPDPWAVAVLGVVAVVGAGLAAVTKRLAPALASAWGLVWIAVARTTDEPRSVPTAVAAGVAAAVVLGTAVVARLRDRGHRDVAAR